MFAVVRVGSCQLQYGLLQYEATAETARQVPALICTPGSARPPRKSGASLALQRPRIKSACKRPAVQSGSVPFLVV